MTVTSLRQELKIGLHTCDAKQQLLFKRMYSHNNITLSINEVVDSIEEEKLEWALVQVNATIAATKE